MLVTNGMIMIAGQVSSSHTIDYDKLIRDKIFSIGYGNREFGFDPNNIAILTAINAQNHEYAAPVKDNKSGDIAIVYGYACNETIEYLPFSLSVAQNLLNKINSLRESNEFYFISPDIKILVITEYDLHKKPNIKSIIILTHHLDTININALRKEIEFKSVFPILDFFKTKRSDLSLHINPTGPHICGGPSLDSGVTGRKIDSDTYGGVSRAGGVLSGKDPSKIDRCGSYMARYIAKNLVAAGIVERLEIQLTYILGSERPINIYVDTFNTEKIPKLSIYDILCNKVDFSIGYIKTLLLHENILYAQASQIGHFGHDFFPWERTNLVAMFQNGL
jgi:S-adenosylmethionine synthetase